MKVTVPPGCTGLDMQDGTRYTAPRQGGHINVHPAHVAAVKRSWYGDTGTIATSEGFSFGTRRGRRCPTCSRVWNVWSTRCPKCTTETIVEEPS